MRAVTKEQAQQWRLRTALAQRQRGFIINPYVFGAGGGEDVVFFNPSDKSANITLSNSDRTAELTNLSGAVRVNVARAATYKAYFEFKLLVTGGAYPAVGLVTAAYDVSSGVIGTTALGWSVWMGLGWVRYNNSTVATLGAFSVNDIANVAVDMAAGKIWFGKNNSWSGNPAAGTGEASNAIPTSGNLYAAFSAGSAGDKATINAETAQLVYSPPAGFSAWSVP